MGQEATSNQILRDRYRIQRWADCGGFSSVWLAKDTLTDNDVVLKVANRGAPHHARAAANELAVLSLLLQTQTLQHHAILDQHLAFQQQQLIDSHAPHHAPSSHATIQPIPDPAHSHHHQPCHHEHGARALQADAHSPHRSDPLSTVDASVPRGADVFPQLLDAFLLQQPSPSSVGRQCLVLERLGASLQALLGNRGDSSRDSSKDKNHRGDSNYQSSHMGSVQARLGDRRDNHSRTRNIGLHAAPRQPLPPQPPTQLAPSATPTGTRGAGAERCQPTIKRTAPLLQHPRQLARRVAQIFRKRAESAAHPPRPPGVATAGCVAPSGPSINTAVSDAPGGQRRAAAAASTALAASPPPPPPASTEQRSAASEAVAGTTAATATSISAASAAAAEPHRGGGLPLAEVRCLTRHVLQALDIMHRSHGIVHRDVKPGNILSSHPQQPGLIHEVGGNAVSATAVTGGTGWRLIDFGTACCLRPCYAPLLRCDGDDASTVLYDTAAYAPPEALLGLPTRPGYDVWSLACCVYEVASGRKLFDPSDRDVSRLPSNEVFGADDHHLWLMAGLLGRMPLQVRKRSPNARAFFTPRGRLHLEASLPLGRCPLVQRLREEASLDELEVDRLAAFLTPMLEYDADARPSAQQLLQHPWLTQQ